MIDIQSRMTEGKGIGYKRWAKKHNLKVMAQTRSSCRKRLTDEDALNQRIAELETKYHDSLAVVKDLEGRMKRKPTKSCAIMSQPTPAPRERRTAVKDRQNDPQL